VNDPAAHQAADKAARESYGRLLAILSARTHDIAASEDALADAFARALERWPADGIPAQPDAWLLSVARHRKLDAWRHTRVQDQATQTLLLLAGEMDEASAEGTAVPDERLRLLFVCAHPAIDAAARAPLMLQTVLGLDAARMAGAFLTAPSTLGQRLVRAKARIRAAGIPFEYPQARDLPQRLQDVLDGIYAAYGTGWDDVDGADALPRGLTSEAIDLGRILCHLMPDEPEPLGLRALMLFCESRAAARRSETGAYVPLDQQDTLRWDPDLLAEAERCLRLASEMKSLGRTSWRRPSSRPIASAAWARRWRPRCWCRCTKACWPCGPASARRSAAPARWRMRAARSRTARARSDSLGRGGELPAVLGRRGAAGL
jgi:RNA polymerase sigma-70 factor (ECF subfamily)